MSLEMVACRYPGKKSSSKPACFVTIHTARELVEAGEASWSKGAKYLIFTKLEAEMMRADRSLTMGPAVIFANACGEADAMALVAAWRTNVRASDPYDLAA